MRTYEQLSDRIADYKHCEVIYDPAVGYIVWRTGTGDNLELLFIEAVEPRKGHGTELYRRMVRRVNASGRRPYHSFFGFRLASNTAADKFYSKLGFQQQLIESTDMHNHNTTIYGGDQTVLMWIAWDDLVHNLGLDGETA